ncbi:MAG: hypothetical protein LLG15_01750 [Betaproteobacteria bacterium]|nr:hypothetical protein [Betaproteobacteria bacterium]
MRLVFDQTGDFKAKDAAEDWCQANGISVGSTERGKPRGLLRGDFIISKWHNMSAAEIAELDGRMTGNMRHGPVIVEINGGVA